MIFCPSDAVGSWTFLLAQRQMSGGTPNTSHRMAIAFYRVSSRALA
jgi:hypothetical protein